MRVLDYLKFHREKALPGLADNHWLFSSLEVFANSWCGLKNKTESPGGTLDEERETCRAFHGLRGLS